jgi:hypothetical protein
MNDVPFETYSLDIGPFLDKTMLDCHDILLSYEVVEESRKGR